MVYMYIQSSFMFLRFAICEIRKKATKDTGGGESASKFFLQIRYGAFGIFFFNSCDSD